MVGGYNGLAAIGAHLFVAAVVEKYYVAAAYLSLNLSFYQRCRWGIPVVAGDVPHDWFEA